MLIAATVAVVIAIIVGASLYLIGVLKMATALEDLRREVAETRSVSASLRQLLNGLAQRIADNAGNETAMKELANELDADQAENVAAVTANTPAADLADEEAPVEPGEQPGTGDAPQG